MALTARQIRIGIVGAGIGGLTLALALRQRGLTADVYEQASELREIGAAVALTANGTREFQRMGCLDAIAAPHIVHRRPPTRQRPRGFSSIARPLDQRRALRDAL